MPSREELKLLQSLPLDVKIRKTQQRIREWVEYYGEDGVYVSFSGGKDSTVLLDIARKMYPGIEAVFVNTGLEYPEIVDFVKQHENVTILRPKRNFRQVLTEYGYPVISKEVSQKISEVLNKPDGYAKRSFDGSKKGTPYDYSKYNYLINSPFKISANCCPVMKKNPFKKFEKQSKKSPIMGILCNESAVREKEWIVHGCNAFKKKETKAIHFPSGQTTIF